MLRPVTVVTVTAILSGPLLAGELGFDERLRAQRAIERVYHTHRTASRRPFDAAVTRELLERKLREQARRDARLREWGRTVDAADLERELQRIVQATRFPDRLLELIETLDRDPVLVYECLVRPVVTQRLLAELAGPSAERTAPERSSFPGEPQLESVAGVELLSLDGVVAELQRQRVFDPSCAADDSWDDGLPETVNPRSRHSAVWTGSEMIVWGGLQDAVVGPLTTGERFDPVLDSWTAISSDDAPQITGLRHPVVWTGDEMIVWGGDGEATTGTPDDQGRRYDPVSDSWTPMQTFDAPAPRWGHSVVWTGEIVLVWGGFTNPTACTDGNVQSGAAWNPLSDSWFPISAVNAPAVAHHAAVWTGSEMIVHGGQKLDFHPQSQQCDTFVQSGTHVYDPLTDSWSTAAAGPSTTDHEAVWTGEEMIVWNDGQSGRFDPPGNQWNPLSAVGEPTPRAAHSTIWTGDEMLVWGGGASLDTGGRYDPQTDSWAPTSSTGAPGGRGLHTAVWTGEMMIVWGGEQSAFPNLLGSGGRYAVGNPDADGDGTADGCDICPLAAADDADADGFCEDVDNCDVVRNPQQRDDDADGVGNLCDGCPQAADAGQTDTDGDGAGDACDCELWDPGDLAPAAVASLTLTRSDAATAALSWSAAAGADVYSISRGLLSLLGPAAYGHCLAEGLAGTTFDDPEPPPPGAGYAYLIQAQNVECGLGTLGFAADETLRQNLDAAACSGITVSDVVADAETTIYGAVAGSYVDTQTSDDTVESLTEEQTSGNPAQRISRLEHRWQFTLPDGGPAEFHVEGFRGVSADGDDFVFEFSTDGGAGWQPVALTSLPTADDDIDLAGSLPPAVAGTLLVRVIDTDRTPGNAAPDSVFLDRLFVRVFPAP